MAGNGVWKSCIRCNELTNQYHPFDEGELLPCHNECYEELHYDVQDGEPYSQDIAADLRTEGDSDD